VLKDEVGEAGLAKVADKEKLGLLEDAVTDDQHLRQVHLQLFLDVIVDLLYKVLGQLALNLPYD